MLAEAIRLTVGGPGTAAPGAEPLAPGDVGLFPECEWMIPVGHLEGERRAELRPLPGARERARPAACSLEVAAGARGHGRDAREHGGRHVRFGRRMARRGQELVWAPESVSKWGKWFTVHHQPAEAASRRLSMGDADEF